MRCSSLKWHFWICHGCATFCTFSWTGDHSLGWTWTSFAKRKEKKRQEQMPGAKDAGNQRGHHSLLKGLISQGHVFFSGSTSQVLLFTWAAIRWGRWGSNKQVLPERPRPHPSDHTRSESTQNSSRGHCGVRNHTKSCQEEISPDWIPAAKPLNSALLEQNRKNVTADGQVGEDGQLPFPALLFPPLAVHHTGSHTGSSFWHAVNSLTSHSPLRQALSGPST